MLLRNWYNDQAVTYLSVRVIFNDCKLCFSAGVAEHGQRRRVPLKRDADASGAYPAEVRGFKSHPLHHEEAIE